jgi:hypothetical protein
MPQHPQPKCLTLDLRGDLSLEKFEKAISAFFDLIKAVTSETVQDGRQFKWAVTVRSGSALVNAIPHYDEETEGAALDVLRAVPAGIRSLESGAKEPPRLFNQEAVKAVKELGSLRGLKSEDVTGVRIRSASERCVITKIAPLKNLVLGLERFCRFFQWRSSTCGSC